MKALCLSVLLALGMSACGYHLVGQGDDSGVIPEDAAQVVLVATVDAKDLLTVFRQNLKQSLGIPVVRKDEEQGLDSVEVRLENVSETMTASAFDTSGVANQYRVKVSASLRVSQSGKELWVSGVIAVSADVFGTGGAVAIEAQKERVLENLRDEWVQKATAWVRSGF